MATRSGLSTSARAIRRKPMHWSWKLAEVAGIRVYVHATFLLLVAWFAVAYWFEVGMPRASLRELRSSCCCSAVCSCTNSVMR